VSWDAYCQRLSAFGIRVKVRNFLVFQGDIEAVAAKSPQGLTLLMEQVSGSEAYKQQYEELQARAMAAEERVATAFTRKKAVANERKQKKEQKDEAERYVAKQKELLDLRTEHTLFQLHHMKTDRDAALKESKQLQDAAAKVLRDHETFEEQVEGLKRKQAGCAKERMLQEKKVKKLQGEKDKKSPPMVRAKEESMRLTKRIRTGEKELSELEGKAEVVRQRVESLNRELKGIDKARKKLEADARSYYQQHTRRAGANLNSREVQEEYAQIKLQVAEKTAKLASERDTLSTRKKASEDALQQAEAGLEALRSRSQSLRAQAAEARERASAATQAAAAARRDHKARTSERAKIEDQLRKSSSEREFVTKKLEEVEARLQDARSDRKAAGREKKHKEALDALKRMYPSSVYGRLHELGDVMQRQYHLALTVAMGRDQDSVFVDNERTARDAITYLKDQKVPSMTFVPLATCKVKMINERLRSLRGTARLAVDMVQPIRPEMARAFQYAFGNTLVCDGVEEAQDLAFNRGERHKVVSKDGTLFNKAGYITGGSAGNLEERARRWDEKVVDDLKAQREELASRLRALASPGELRERMAAITSELLELDARAAYNDAESQHTSGHADKMDAQAQEVEAEISSKEPQVEQLREAVQHLEEQMQVFNDRVNDIADRLFKPFSERLGLSSIREYEEQHQEFEARTEAEKARLTAQETKIKNQLGYEQGRDLQTPLQKRRDDLDRDKARLEQVQQEVAAAQQALEETDRKIKEVQEAVRAASIEQDKVDADLKDLRKRHGSLATEAAKYARQKAAAEGAAAAAEQKAKDLIASAALDQLPVPRVGGSTILSDEGAAAAGAGEEGEGAEPMDVDGEAGPSTGPSSRGGAGSATLYSIDFSGLKVPKSAKDREATLRELQEAIDAAAADLEGRSPNLRAVEQYDTVKEKEKEMNAVLEEAKREAHSAQAGFNTTRDARTQAFLDAFNHISNEIDVIYKELTRSSMHPLGGNAYLSLEDQDEPYQAGIKYTAMPPTKRFRDMEQLSGGEKTVAALALLFAIHSYRPSPFFVLDEVDAALDATNVARVAHYIRDKTRGLGNNDNNEAEQRGVETDRGPSSFQSIVISLKDIFYEKADALVGVARDVDGACSRTFTFDLSAFGEPQPAED